MISPSTVLNAREGVESVARPRVSLVSYDFGEYCVRLASALTAHAEVQLLIASDEGDAYRDLLSPHVIYRPFQKPRLRQPVGQVASLQGLWKEMGAFRPDLVHIQQGHLWLNLALPLLRGPRLVITAHDPRRHPGDQGAAKTPQWLMTMGFRRADRLIAHGEQLRDDLVEYCGIPMDRVDVVPHIELGEEAPAVSTERERGEIVLFLGRIWPYKGLDYLIRAEPLISAAVPNTRFVIAGEGEPFDRYQALMQHPDRFTVLNRFVSDEERAALFQEASVVVLPYIEASQSGVIPLAYRFRKPVVATTVGSLPEAVDHGHTGLLVPPRDEQALARAVIQLLSNPDLRARMGAAGLAKLTRECGAEHVAQLTADCYRRALQPSPRTQQQIGA